MSTESQNKRMIREMKKRKVKNHEFMNMYILSYTKRIAEIRNMGFIVNKERIYDADGKATNTFAYWIPRKRRKKTVGPAIDGMKYEDVSESNWLRSKLNTISKG